MATGMQVSKDVGTRVEVGIKREEQGRRVNRGLDVLLACRSELSSKQAEMLNQDRLVRHGGPGLADRGSRTATGCPRVTDRECVVVCVPADLLLRNTARCKKTAVQHRGTQTSHVHHRNQQMSWPRAPPLQKTIVGASSKRLHAEGLSVVANK